MLWVQSAICVFRGGRRTIFKLKAKHHLEWDALDGEPVDILFFLISSPRQGDGADHVSDCGMAAVRPGAGGYLQGEAGRCPREAAHRGPDDLHPGATCSSESSYWPTGGIGRSANTSSRSLTARFQITGLSATQRPHPGPGRRAPGSHPRFIRQTTTRSSDRSACLG